MEWTALVANQLHDLKNQLGVLMQRIDSGDTEDIATLQKSSRLIHDDLSMLLTLFRLKEGEDQFKLTRFDLPLCDVPEEAAARHQPLIERAKIDLTIECHPHQIGFYDRPLLVSIIAHGVLNAINAGASKIILRATEYDGGALFEVEDNGSGLEKGKAIQGSGTGVGLRLGSEIAQAHKRSERAGWLKLEEGRLLEGARLQLWIP